MKLKCLLLFLFPGCIASMRADVMNFGAGFGTATRDNTIFSDATGNSDGGGPAFFVGDSTANTPRRALIYFDLSSIPSNAMITDVQLTLTVGMLAGMAGTSTRTIGLFPVSTAWGEGSVLNSATSISGTGGGGTAGTGDATWADSAVPTAWTTAGGDHGAQSASLTLTNATVNQSFTWDSASLINSNLQLENDVQSWVNGTATNNGWELINSNETGNQTFDAFYSAQGTHISTVTAGELPSLQVSFTVPEPAAGSLAVVSLLTIFSSRPWRRRT